MRDLKRLMLRGQAVHGESLCFEHLDGHRLIKEISLKNTTACVKQKIELCLGFNPFSDHSQPESLAQIECRSNDACTRAVCH